MVLSSIKFQQLTDKHLPQVLELDKLCFGGLWTLEGYQREINSPNSELLIICLDSDDQEIIIGIGCYWHILEEAHITILAIHPDFQGQGLGKLLLNKLLDLAKNKALERATLEVGENNKIALSLYQKFGFQIAGRRKKYYQKTGEDALILWKKLTNTEKKAEN